MSAADITGRLARYMVEARERSLPPDVAREAKHRILDSLAAMVSGAHLKPGEMAIKYARAQGGVAEATVVTTDIRTTAVNAALANAMFAHADETDDFHPATKAHPGCSVVPTALAMAERESCGHDGAARMGFCRRMEVIGLVGMGEHRVGQSGVDGRGPDVGRDDCRLRDPALRSRVLDSHLSGLEMG